MIQRPLRPVTSPAAADIDVPSSDTLLQNLTTRGLMASPNASTRPTIIAEQG